MSHTPTFLNAFDAKASDNTIATLSGMPSGALKLAEHVFGHSPYLAGLARRSPEYAVEILSCSSEQHFTLLFEDIVTKLQEPRQINETDEAFDAVLRQAKAHVALLVATADIGGFWPLDTVTRSLSSFANLCLELALARAIQKRWRSGELRAPDGYITSTAIDTAYNEGCGFFFLGLGKLGGLELNYSSDIDIIALYDPDRMQYTGRKSLSDCCIKITQEVVRHIDMRSMYGYVFRVDLRLRPDPGATPVALSVGAAMTYYHSIALNWERAAMIKASFAAGDQGAAEAYLDELTPWIWRRSIDYGALQDISAIKNQVNRHNDIQENVFLGFDVKLGVGGIREIEFYAQVNQLLHGGRNHELRTKSTLDTLKHLVDLQLLSENDCNHLTCAYEFLRNTEHRIQMIADEQTHSIPTDENAALRLARFMGFETLEAFQNTLEAHTRKVSQLYDDLLPEQEDATEVAFTEHKVKKLLENKGFQDISAAATLIEGWFYGRYRALKTERARRLLGQCLPALLNAYSNSQSPDNALRRLDGFLSTLPSGVQLFSMLQANPSLLSLLARITSSAPALSSILAKHPALWDAVLSGQFYQSVGSVEDLMNELKHHLDVCRDFQDILDFTRRFAAEYHFKTGVHLLEGLSDARETGKALSSVADAVMKTLLPHVEAQFKEKHGDFGANHTGLAVLALGNYGGQEITHTSDLDILFVYGTQAEQQFSNGDKPLSPAVYYSRLAQHMITALTALTPEGRLYEVDTRLRPSGNQGPLATSLDAFNLYYNESAWTWEFLALTRARVVAASSTLTNELADSIKSALVNGPKQGTLMHESVEMRKKLSEQFYQQNIWDVKHAPGGLVDIEFICQSLSLQNMDLLGKVPTNIGQCLDYLKQNDCMTVKDAETLVKGYQFQRYLQLLLRLCLEQTPEGENDIPSDVYEIIARAIGSKNQQSLAQDLTRIQNECRGVFNTVFEQNISNIIH